MRDLQANIVKVIGLLFGGLVGSHVSHASEALPHALLRPPVVEIRADRPDGTLSLGSGILLGTERLVTNCHVVQGARSTKVVHDGRDWTAHVETADIHHDLCVMRAPGMSGRSPVPALQVSVGQKVFAVGFPAGQPLSVSEGRIVALHHYDGGHVLQISAPFDRGESGGGLFDVEGRLIGILAFKAPVGGVFHFALPVAWLDSLAGDAPKRSLKSQPPFWQVPYAKLPDFLRVLSVQATNAGTHSVH